MNEPFARTQIESLSVSRMIIGSNWILGYSHTSGAADDMIRYTHRQPNATVELLCTFLENGVDTLMGPFALGGDLVDAVRRAEDICGKPIILVDTPTIDVHDSAQARASARELFAGAKRNGAKICMPHHSSVERLMNKLDQTLTRLPDYTDMIRQEGMIPGLSAHAPECILYSDANEYDVQTYISIYNCMGFLMQVEIEYINKVIWNAKKPVMTIKPMAAGRVSPFVGLNFSWATLRPIDMVTVGCLNAREAAEDIEISRAALEMRAPKIAGRASPNRTEIMRD